jgi:hypothetical protein
MLGLGLAYMFGLGIIPAFGEGLMMLTGIGGVILGITGEGSLEDMRLMSPGITGDEE